MPLEQVAELVTQWRRARGSMERVRVIASGARTLGSLTPDDRRALAEALVEHGAPDVAARLEPRTRGALSAGELTDLARAVLSVDRATLDGVATSLGDPDERRRLLPDAGTHLEDLLDAPSGAAVPLPPPPHVPPGAGAARIAPPAAPQREAPELTSPGLGEAGLGTADLGTAGLRTADLGTAGLRTADLDAAGLEAADVGPADGPLSAAAAARRDPDHRPRAAAADPSPASTSGGQAVVAAPPPVAVPEPALVRSRADVGATLDRLATAATARERLATVAALEAHHLGTDQLLRVLDALPDGWQRRTAARRLVEAGATADVDGDALVRRFARAADRVAVAGSLVDAGASSLDAVAAAIGPRAAGRLRRRAAGR